MRMQENDTVVDNLRMILLEKRIPQRELAKRLTLSEATISKILNKRRAITSAEIDKIAQILDIPVQTLYDPVPLVGSPALDLMEKIRSKESELSELAERTLFYKRLLANTANTIDLGTQS